MRAARGAAQGLRDGARERLPAHGRVVGVLSDRDAALRVVGFQLDPTEVTLKDAMTEHPATLPIQQSERAALELMRDRHVRRIPLLDGDAVVGLVTLDDLILSFSPGWRW